MLGSAAAGAIGITAATYLLGADWRTFDRSVSI
jgi:hypothetical protein